MAEVIKMPKLSDTMEEGVIATWEKKVGDQVNAGDVLAEIESDKATMEFESFHAGTLLHIEIPAGKSTQVDGVIAIIGEKGEDIEAILKAAKAETPTKKEETVESKPSTSAPVKQESKPSPAAPAVKAQPRPVEKSPVVSDDSRTKISPLAKRLAEERGVSLRGIRGSGENGRIVKRDIESSNLSQIPQVERYRDVETSQMRKTIARRLSESKFTAPHFYLTIDLDMDRAVEARKAINDAITPEKISYNDLVIKAAAIALKDHPNVNAGWFGDFIRYNEHVHIGVAVAVDEGLLVPVVRHADGKVLTQISAEVRDYAKRAKTKKLQPEDWQGNTFTISNLGMFGIEEFTAIINPPDSCIMAVGSIRQEPVVKDGEIKIGNRMKVTLSCDHRVVDGVLGAQFLETFRKYIENPIVLLGMSSI
ncbi:pyruvate dehydrogenase complex dihydrolipoamide acetyltransferase [Salibacteraceae bacterium]|mgnify:FL=1|jgi:pyruvate dehydrogenase E2 component (dihydrolipoamide acetyltransferase)|nr:pyruvate dehydrogenase complex dihydrolipoamide acetyltransferase [Salibacteraceae bacterium]MDB4105035.1 pyruvate dehydrogenase complex dihydrolipoamide acetyltransferase [Salibacteraceae bacterium]MDB9709669.1 pyruvate dehydrogenase complex dihydrolipoamide acetyltransferase [Salibacteraceae bacterium]MDC1303852.1 pyruvate dehydrogenase complex dihydrolipoamide acetyltransferase [Salibacteraceae bacterium]